MLKVKILLAKKGVKKDIQLNLKLSKNLLMSKPIMKKNCSLQLILWRHLWRKGPHPISEAFGKQDVFACLSLKKILLLLSAVSFGQDIVSFLKRPDV